MHPNVVLLVAVLAQHTAVATLPVCGDKQPGIELGTDSLKPDPAASTVDACCQACLSHPKCVAWSFSNKTKWHSGTVLVCTLGAKLGTRKSKPWVTSGVRGAGPPPPFPPPSPPPPSLPGDGMSATVSFDATAPIFTVEEHYLSYTIDTSAERGFFQRDLTNPRLRWLAKQLSPAVLRVGGSGSDELYYNVGDARNPQCPGAPFPKCKKIGTPHMSAGEEKRRAGVAYCLNTSQWDAVNDFAAAAGAHLVFGLNFFLNASSTQVASLLRYTAERKFSVYGYEYGNEQIKAPQTVCRDRQVAQGVALSQHLAQLYPPLPIHSRGASSGDSAAGRPRLIGPDAGGTVSAGYLAGLAKGGSSLLAYTYHQYSLSRNSTAIPPSRLMSPAKAASKAKGLQLATKGLHWPAQQGVRVQLWAGEAGGTGGGGIDNVTNSFVSGLWYLDSLGLYAASGTSVFCRQDLVGAFCTSHSNPPVLIMIFAPGHGWLVCNARVACTQ
jgi:hypothetical protein